jgi:uncharacterized membrane protein
LRGACDEAISPVISNLPFVFFLLSFILVTHASMPPPGSS